MKNNKPKILVLDIETTPLLVYSWGIWDVTITPGQIKDDWSILSWAAIWMDEPDNKIMYSDTRHEKNPRNDKACVKKIHKLMLEADIIIGQNSDAFDIKKLNTRFVMHGLSPIPPHKTRDTKKIAKKYFAFTSNSLDYMTTHLNKKHTKLSSGGLSLWIRCLNKELKAFKEMEGYNKEDTLSTKELYKDTLQKWDQGLKLDIYNDNIDIKCNCGSYSLIRRGYTYTKSGKHQKLQCKNCGSWHQTKENLLSPEKKKSLFK